MKKGRKIMLETFSTKAVQLIDEAKQLSKEMSEVSGTIVEVTTYHLLLSMFLANDTICHFLLKEENKTLDDIVNARSKITYTEELGTVFTKEFEAIVALASRIALKVESEYVYDEHLFYAILEHQDNLAVKVINELNLNIDLLKQDIEDIFNFYQTEIIYQPQKEEQLKYLICLSDIKHIHPYITRSTYIEQMIYILNKRQKNNPLLIGSAGVGKTALVEGLTKYISEKIYELDLGGMIAGTKYRGEMEEKIINAIEYVSKNNGILFIDEIHNIVGAGSNDGSLDLANLLKPYLSKGVIKIIAATTLDEYYQYMDKDKALTRRFQNIFIDEPTKEETVTILKGIKTKYEEYYHTVISDELIEYIVKQTDDNLLNKKFPDKAIDVLDETFSRYRLKQEDLKKLVLKVIENINGIKLPTKEEIQTMKLNYEELVPFYLRKLYPLTNVKNLGIIKVNHNFKINLLLNDLNQVFNFKKEMLLTIDANDYQTIESINNLTGSSKGYVGYEQGGLLYNHILKYPISLIYLKNFNQSVPSFKVFFKDLFKKDYITDAHMRMIYLKNTLFIVQDIDKQITVGFVNQQNRQNKYYDYYLKKQITMENLEIDTYLLKKGIIIEGLKHLSEQEQLNLFYQAITKPMGKYKVKLEQETIVLEQV